MPWYQKQGGSKIKIYRMQKINSWGENHHRAGEEEHYNIECKGHRGGYYMPDKYGEYLGDEKRRQEKGEDWIWHGVPAELETDLDMDDVLRRWKAYSPVRSHLSLSPPPGSAAQLTYRRRRTTRTFASRTTPAITSATSSTSRRSPTCTRRTTTAASSSCMCPPRIPRLSSPAARSC